MTFALKLLLVAAITLGLSVPAGAHTLEEVRELEEAALEDFYTAVIAHHGLIPLEAAIAYLEAVEAARALYTPPPTKSAPSASSSPYDAPDSWVAGAEQWRPLVATYFPDYMVDYALAVIWCESRGDPTAKNPSSSASGLFQHLARYWPDRSTAAGIPGADIFDPTASTIVAAWLVLEAPGGGWHHWTCRP